jgi:hypothetical protein
MKLHHLHMKRHARTMFAATGTRPKCDPPEVRLAKKFLDDYSKYVRTVWLLYAALFAVLMTLNCAAIVLTVQYVKTRQPGILIAASFILINAAGIGAAAGMLLFSRDATSRMERIDRQTILYELAKWLGDWGAIATFIPHALFLAVWVLAAVFFRISPQ